MRFFGITALIAGLALWTVQASAHAFLKTASPAVGSTVSQPPTQVVINFTEGVEPRFSTITVQNAQGLPVETSKPHLVGGDTHLAVDLKPLPPGTYTVVWHATATDTHKTQGSFHFTIGSK
jgi:copper resistance protein C